MFFSFFQGLSVRRTDLISHRTDTNFPREHIQIFQESLFSHRTDTNFPRNPYLFLEHIQIFQEKQILIFQEVLSSPRTIFQASLEHIGFSWKIVCVRGLDRVSWKIVCVRRLDRASWKISICSIKK